MVSAQLLEKDRAKIPQKVPFFLYTGASYFTIYALCSAWWGVGGSDSELPARYVQDVPYLPGFVHIQQANMSKAN